MTDEARDIILKAVAHYPWQKHGEKYDEYMKRAEEYLTKFWQVAIAYRDLPLCKLCRGRHVAELSCEEEIRPQETVQPRTTWLG